MNADDSKAEMQALCTRAAEQEARRQSAAARGDCDTAQAAERELSRLWARYLQLEQGDT